MDRLRWRLRDARQAVAFAARGQRLRWWALCLLAGAGTDLAIAAGMRSAGAGWIGLSAGTAGCLLLLLHGWRLHARHPYGVTTPEEPGTRKDGHD